MFKNNCLKRGLSFLLIVIFIFSFVPTNAITVSHASTTAVKFTWNGTEYSIDLGGSGSVGGLSWTCDSTGNFKMTFTDTGTNTLEFTDGSISNANVTVVGGGAGGSSGKVL